MTARFSGPQGKGAARLLRELKHAEAAERNAKTRPENRKSARLGMVKAILHRGGRTIALRYPLKEDTA